MHDPWTGYRLRDESGLDVGLESYLAPLVGYRVRVIFFRDYNGALGVIATTCDKEGVDKKKSETDS